jgi:hypothetical protein
MATEKSEKKRRASRGENPVVRRHCLGGRSSCPPSSSDSAVGLRAAASLAGSVLGSVGVNSPAATSAAPAVALSSVPRSGIAFPAPVLPPAAVAAPAQCSFWDSSPREAAAQCLAELWARSGFSCAFVDCSPSTVPVCSLSPPGCSSVRGRPPLTEVALRAALPRIIAAGDELGCEHTLQPALVLLELLFSSGRSATRGRLPVHGAANLHSRARRWRSCRAPRCIGQLVIPRPSLSSFRRTTRKTMWHCIRARNSHALVPQPPVLLSLLRPVWILVLPLLGLRMLK